jgi:hypothetical protein
MEKKVKIILIVLHIFIAANTLMAQNLQLYIKRGTALKNGSLLHAGSVTEIQPKDEVSVSLHSLAFILNNNKMAELAPGKTYKLDDLKSLTQNKAGYTKAFINILTNQDYSHKPKSGISMRDDSSKDLWYYWPADSCTVLSDKLYLGAGSDGCRYESKIVLKGKDHLDSIETIENKLEYEVKQLPPGEYSWSYKLACGGSVKGYRNIFYIPEQAEKSALLAKHKAYKNSITGFSVEMQTFLLEEFKFLNRIYL